MYRIAAYFFLLCLSACARTHHVQMAKFVAEDAVFEKIAKANERNIVFIIVAVSEDKRYTGTAFVVGRNGYLLTNNHMVKAAGDGKIFVKIKNGNRVETRVVKEIVRVLPQYDLALIKIDYQFKTAMRTKARLLKSGEPVFSMGYAHTAVNKFSWKTALKKSFGRFYLYAHAVWPANGFDMQMQLCTTKVAKGASGSPVFDANGDVVGVISMTMPLPNSYQVYDWAVPIRYYERFLKPLQK